MKTLAEVNVGEEFVFSKCLCVGRVVSHNRWGSQDHANVAWVHGCPRHPGRSFDAEVGVPVGLPNRIFVRDPLSAALEDSFGN